MWWIWVLSLVAGVVLLDQVTKQLVLRFLYEGEVALIEGVLHFTYVENRGMAFGMLSEHRWVFLLFSTVGIVAMALYLWFFAKSPLSRAGLALAIGGGIGNMIDRVALGFVVDFIDFCAFDFWVWVFNVADAAVCVGVGLVVLDLCLELIRELKKKPPTKSGAPDGEEGDHGTKP